MNALPEIGRLTLCAFVLGLLPQLANAQTAPATQEVVVRPATMRSYPNPKAPQPTSRPAARLEAELVRRDSLQPKRITIHLKDATRQALFDALADQSGYTFEIVEKPAHRQLALPQVVYDFDADKASFWSVFRRLCRMTGLRFQNPGAPEPEQGPSAANHIKLVPSGSDDARDPGIFTDTRMIWDDGPILVQPVDVHVFEKTFLATDDPQPHGWTWLRLAALPQPGLEVIPSSLPPVIDEVQDDTGASLAWTLDRVVGPMRAQLDNRHRPPGIVPVEWVVQCNLTVPARDATQIDTIRGEARFVQITRAIRLTIHDVLNSSGAIVEGDGFRVTVGEAVLATTGQSQCYVPFTLERQDLPDDAWTALHEAFLATVSKAVLVNEEGHRIPTAGYMGAMGVRNNASPVVQSQSFSINREAQGPLKLVWEVPVVTEIYPAPFEFHNIPLPNSNAGQP